MSFSIDVNLLLYASDTSSGSHEQATKFLQSVVEGNETCYLTWLTVMSYVRMATHPRIFSAPLSQAEAEGNVEQLMSSHRVMMIGEDDGFWDIYREVSGEMPVRGNLVPDAHLAALLKQHGVSTLYSRDRDFHKFSFLRVIDPIERDQSIQRPK